MSDPVRFYYVVPIHNAGAIILEKVETLARYLQKFPGSEIILVENGSSDNSKDILQSIPNSLFEVPIHTFSLKERGMGRAYRHAIEWIVSSDRVGWVVLTAIDLPFQFSDSEELLRIVSSNPKLEIGVGSKCHSDSKTERGWGRILLSRVFQITRKLWLGTKTKDTQGTFFVRTEILPKVLPALRADNYFITTELSYCAELSQMNLVEFPVIHRAGSYPSSVRPVIDGAIMLAQLIRLKRGGYLAKIRVNKLPEAQRSWWEVLLSLGIGLTVFWSFFSFAIVNPTFLDWLVIGDSRNYILGWKFFRKSDWTFPLGGIPQYGYPIGTTALLCDLIPIVAVFFKVLSDYLPENFQYFGMWLLLCYLLQAYFSYRVMSLLTDSPVVRALGTIFLSMSPVLLNRMRHYALCAHWIFIFLLEIAIRLNRQLPSRDFRIPFLPLLLLNIFLAGLHPYLLVASMFLTGTFYLQAFRYAYGSACRELAFQFCAIVAAITVSGYIWGFFAVQEPTAMSAGFFPVDLLGLMNSMGVSRIFPAISKKGRISEGFAYLGLGGFLLFGLSKWFKTRERVPFLH